MSGWIDHAIWWQVYPLGFTGAPVRPEDDSQRRLAHRLGHLVDWLDHVVELGCNGLQLGPVFSATSHGYDTLDHFTIDPRLGDDGDFDALVTACRGRGVHLVLDGVFNHVGEHHPLYRAALANGPDSDEAQLFRIDWQATPPRAENFEGHGSLVALDHESQATVDLVAGVMRHWLSRGIAGWRLDAAYAVRPEFWARVMDQVRPEFGDAWFVGEMIHGDYADYVDRSGLDSMTEYELWKSTWSALADANFFELDWTLKRHNELLGHFLPLTFVGNHDVTRIATKVGPDKARLATVLLFTVGGTPSIYYGDEFGWTGEKRDDWGGDDDVRPVFPASPDEITLGHEQLRLHQQLVALRRQNPWLSHATTETVELRNEYLKYVVRGGQAQELWVELDLSEGARARVSDPFGTVLLEA